MTTIKKTLLITTLIGTSVAAYANFWVADIRVESINSTVRGTNFSCNAVIASSHDDDARNAKAIILFSPEIKYSSSRITNLNRQRYPRTRNDGRGANCRVSRATGALHGIAANGQNSYLECRLGHLSTQAKLQIKVTGTVTRRTSFRPNCSVLVLSSTPDPKPGNNYKAGR